MDSPYSFLPFRFTLLSFALVSNPFEYQISETISREASEKLPQLTVASPLDDAITARGKLNRGKIRRSRTTRCVATDGVERWSVDVTSVVEKLSGV